MANEFSIHVMNQRKKRGKKKSARKGKPMAKKRKTKKRRRAGNPYVAAAPQTNRKKKRRSSGGGSRRKKRRKNPLGGGARGGIIGELEGFLPRFVGKLVAAAAAQRFGGGSWLGSPTTSVTAGSSWSGQQYLASIVGVVLASRLLGKLFDEKQVRRGGFDLIMTKFFWTEGIARSGIAASIFGQTDSQVRVDPTTGQTYYFQNGQWNAMQGYGGYGDELVTASPYDDTLVSASPLDGLRQAGPLDYGGHSYMGVADSSKVAAERFKQLYAV